ncbi:hypothetical protein L2Y94_11945 [Luteibacter aegosomatis]|uniref:hypothetical protein n=1 Tax=Luteibacter aegosomatis TaxID=2911537 RepID=UPI001FF9E9EC|nr:hypothetical protein L2Y94_11945 [Luteibacter aegosomatis]
MYATTSDDARLSRPKPYGMTAGINSVTNDFVKEIAALTDGRGVDLILDSIARRWHIEGGLLRLEFLAETRTRSTR